MISALLSLLQPRLGPSKEAVVEAESELLKSFLESRKPFFSHQGGKSDAAFRPNNCRPVILDHCRVPKGVVSEPSRPLVLEGPSPRGFGWFRRPALSEHS